MQNAFFFWGMCASVLALAWQGLITTKHLIFAGSLLPVIAKAHAICPILANAPVLQRWSGIRPKARRRDPMLGPVPNLRGVYTALGAFKIGFGLSHKIGEVVAAQIHEETVELPDSFTLAWHMAK